MIAPKRAERAMAAVGLAFVLLATAAGCTTTKTPDAERNFLPEEYAAGTDVGTYGVIEDDHADYEWTGRRYEDGRFSGELDNSPLRGGEEYRPITSDASDASEVRPSTSKSYASTPKARLTKASKGSAKPKAGKKKR